MQIVKGYPPNYLEIKKRFKVSPRTVFTYGDTVYSPAGVGISEDLKVHETVHTVQQGLVTPEVWWRHYFANADYRFEQELEAYIMQYRYAVANYGRSDRKKLLKHLRKDLAGPMYGLAVSPEEAEKLITEAMPYAYKYVQL